MFQTFGFVKKNIVVIKNATVILREVMSQLVFCGNYNECVHAFPLTVPPCDQTNHGIAIHKPIVFIS